MSLSITAIFDLIAPQYKDNADKNTWISMASQEVSACYFGANRNRAVALLTAHMMTLTLRSGGESGDAGAVTSKKEGDLSITYGSVGKVDDADLGQTSYGRQYISLRRKSNAGGVGVTGGLDNGCEGNWPGVC
jgi:hypothetical protein